MHKKLLIRLLILLILISAIVLVYRFTRPHKVKVIVTSVKRGAITSKVSSTGIVKPVREVNISASISGEIVDLPVNEGDSVKKGDILVQLNKTEYIAQVRQADANLEMAKASLNQSSSQWNRTQILFSKELISELEMEQSRTQYELDKARVKAARAERDRVYEQLRKTVIRAPISGIITTRTVEIGETVFPGTLSTPGTILMVLAELDIMKVECDVDEADIAQIRTGQKATIVIDAFRDTLFLGKVVDIGTSSASQVQAAPSQRDIVNYIVSVQILGSSEGLRTDMSANVDIITAQKNDVLLVPIESVVSLPDENSTSQQGVFTVKNNIAELEPITTGIADNENIEVKSGLSENDTIIKGPFAALRSLKSGSPVKL
jgi:HlyD family secretion protein